MTRTIRLQSDSNAHDRPWRVAVEQGFFAAEGLTVEYHEDNPKGTAGRVEDFSQRWKESQLQKGALEVYPVCEWGAIERVQALGGSKIIGLDTTVRTGALMVRKDSKIQSVSELQCADRGHLARRNILRRHRSAAFRSNRSSLCTPMIGSTRSSVALPRPPR
jgi:hypothetical protein